MIEYARLHPNVLALLDDRAARRAAEALGVKVHGTLGVVAMAARQGHVPSFEAAARQLQAAGLYVNDALVKAVGQGLT